jgi:hypothetical protein
VQGQQHQFVQGQQHQFVQTQPQPQPQAVFAPVSQFNQTGMQVPNPAVQNSTTTYATPLQALNRYPATVHCSKCGKTCMTRTTYVTGNTNHAVALGLFCFTLFFFWVAYLVDSWKNVNHQCGNCGTMLATWHPSGRIDVFQ